MVQLYTQRLSQSTHPSVGENGIALLHQDGFDHGSVGDAQQRLPSIVHAWKAIAVRYSQSQCEAPLKGPECDIRRH